MIRYVYWHWNLTFVSKRFWKNLGLKIVVVGDKINGTAQTTVICISFIWTHFHYFIFLANLDLTIKNLSIAILYKYNYSVFFYCF